MKESYDFTEPYLLFEQEDEKREEVREKKKSNKHEGEIQCPKDYRKIKY